MQTPLSDAVRRDVAAQYSALAEALRSREARARRFLW